MNLRAMRADDWPVVERICALGIASGDATFESQPPTWAEFETAKLPGHSLVAVVDGEVVGWAAASGVSDRCVYAGVAEVSVYVDPAAQGRGVGRALLEALIAFTEREGMWTLQAGIFPENEPSLALHRAVGFRVVGVRERLGRMSGGPRAGQWRDVLLLERRSPTVGA